MLRARIAVGLSQLATGQPDFAAVVVMPQSVRVIQSTDRRDIGTMLLQRLQRLRELVIGPSLGDLIPELAESSLVQ